MSTTTPVTFPSADCPDCHGTGEILVHSINCDDDLCAINGDMHSCAGQLVECQCVERKSQLLVNSYIIRLGKIDGIHIQRIATRSGPDRWAVRKDGKSLTKDGLWEEEPGPSNRTDGFLARCRFDTADSAIRAAFSSMEHEGSTMVTNQGNLHPQERMQD
jgi:hypothetical protein